MALADLLAALEDEGRAEATAIVEGARGEAHRLIHEARARLASQREALRAPQELELRRERQRRLSAARREAQETVLLARRRLFDRVVEAVASEAQARRDDTRMAAAISALTLEAQAFAGSGSAVELDTEAGVGPVVTSADGRVTIDNTLEDRVRRVGPALALAIVEQAEKEP